MAATVVGILKLRLHLPASGSLKSKRMTVGPLLRRIRSRFQVAAAEVGERDRWQLAELAVVCVSSEAAHADEVLARVLRFVEERSDGARVADVGTELLRL